MYHLYCKRTISIFFVAVFLFSGAVLAQQPGLVIHPDLYNEIFPQGEEVTLVADGAKHSAEGSDELPGILFSEGPSWVNGKLYFSSLNFSRGATNSSTIEMDPDGTYRYIQLGMRTNGTMSAGNGNLLVCDMFGHRIVEIKTDGSEVRVVADKLNDGTRLDGPNDLVIDAKGGVYFTDPQYTPGLELAQPGKAVYYANPSGEVVRVIEVGEIAFPNGVLLSPDGSTVYVCNTNENRRGTASFAENFVLAYDVNEDGTLSNRRRFAQMYLSTRDVRSGNKSSGADGMTIDENGNLYVSSNNGVQVFSASGSLIGILQTPVKATNLCFGGDDYKTLYFACNDKIYSMKTNVRGLEYPLK